MNQRKPKSLSQKDYRRTQSNKGFVRFELQVKAATKARFDKLVEAAAKEYVTPYSERSRLAKARADVFDQITQGVIKEFTGLKDQIESLKAEIAALSPNFFKTDLAETTPLPAAIRTLTNDPDQLKLILATTYKQLQTTKQQLRHHKRLSDQFQELYDVSSNYIDNLKQRITDLEEK